MFRIRGRVELTIKIIIRVTVNLKLEFKSGMNLGFRL